MALLSILTAMAAVCNGVSSVGVAYAAPPQAAPKDGNLPAVVPEPSMRAEIAWGNAHDGRQHEIVLDVLVSRGDDLSQKIAAVVPVLEDVLAAFRTNQTLGGLTYECRPTGYEITPISYAGETYVGAAITFTVKEKSAVTFS